VPGSGIRMFGIGIGGMDWWNSRAGERGAGKKRMVTIPCNSQIPVSVKLEYTLPYVKLTPRNV
jgi:hypothetical protein